MSKIIVTNVVNGKKLKLNADKMQWHSVELAFMGSEYYGLCVAIIYMSELIYIRESYQYIQYKLNAIKCQEQHKLKQ